jgi:transcriptional regulator with PAS, ATPase and Fis domain
MRGDAQAKLLRVIEEKTVLPVGGTEEIAIDVRFLAPSNRRPEQAIDDGRLREDLYYRLNGLSIQLPPLRERSDDLPLLIDYFIAQANREHHRKVQGVDDKCRKALGNYHWPGNIRQLHNVIETAVLLATLNQISVNELPEEIRTSANHESCFTVFLGSSLDEVEREFIRRTIAFADRTSEMLGVPRRTLYGKLERYEARHKSNGRANGNGYRARNDRLTGGGHHATRRAALWRLLKDRRYHAT